jgi:hypothetical protein
VAIEALKKAFQLPGEERKIQYPTPGEHVEDQM